MASHQNDQIPLGLTLRTTIRTEGSCQITWSPCGRFLSSGRHRGTIELWDVTSRQLKSILVGHSTGWVVSTAWSPEGTRLASGAGDHTARIWDVEDGRLLRTLEGHEAYVRRVAWSPDGRVLASGSDDNNVRLWDADTGQCLRILTAHSDRVYGLAWNPNGRTIASGSDDGRVLVWSLHDDQKPQELSGHYRSVHSPAWSIDGSRLASGGSRTIQIWDPEDGRSVSVLSGEQEGPVCHLCFSFDNKLLAAKYLYGATRIWDCDSGTCLSTLQERSVASSPPDPDFHPHTHTLATVADDEIIRIWDLDLAQLYQTSVGQSRLQDEGGASGTFPRSLRVFICHASEDKAAARDLYQSLKRQGASPWLDEEDLVPGQDWEIEIRKAVRASHVVVVCLSTRSVDKEGFVQKEIRFALDVAEEKPEGTVFVIPFKLDDCSVPTRLRRWHWVDARDRGGFEKLRRALNLRATDLELG